VIKDMYTIGQAAKYCSISRGTLWKYVRMGELRASLTPGGHHRILKEDLEAFVLKKGMYPLAYKRFSKKRILIVDDNPKIKDMLSKMLKAQRYETEVASSGFGVGAKVMKFKPGLIILDLFMPDIDGFKVCRQIKEDPDTSHIKILAITGYDTKENRDRIMEAGADGCLAKPIERVVLLQRVEELLSKKTVTT